MHAVNNFAWFFSLSNTCFFFATRGVIEHSAMHQRAESFERLLPVAVHLPLTMLYLLFSSGYSLCWSLSSGGPLLRDVEGNGGPTGYEAPWRGERDRRRRPRQYICPGESRKTSERFRTQPITSAERQETDRYCCGRRNA